MGERGGTIPCILKLSLTSVGRILARTYTMDGRTLEQAAGKCQRAGTARGGLVGGLAGQGPLLHLLLHFPEYFRS